MKTKINKHIDGYIDIHQNSRASRMFWIMLTIYILSGVMILGIL
jgi:hypothetical protein